RAIGDRPGRPGDRARAARAAGRAAPRAALHARGAAAARTRLRAGDDRSHAARSEPATLAADPLAAARRTYPRRPFDAARLPGRPGAGPGPRARAPRRERRPAARPAGDERGRRARLLPAAPAAGSPARGAPR